MIRLTLTDDDIRLAERRADALGVLRNSITNGRSNVYGMLGEAVVRRYLGNAASEADDTRDYDIQLTSGMTLEVKTKKTRVVPRPHFESSVCLHNARQRCDAYVFVRVHVDYATDRRAWLLGYLPRPVFFRISRVLRKGDFDPRNRYTVKATCRNVTSTQLRSVVDLVNYVT